MGERRKFEDNIFIERANEFFWVEYAKRHALLHHRKEYEIAKSLYEDIIHTINPKDSIEPNTKSRIQFLYHDQLAIDKFPYNLFEEKPDDDKFSKLYQKYAPNPYTEDIGKKMLRYRELSEAILKKYHWVADVYFFTEFEILNILIDYLNSGEAEPTKTIKKRKGKYFPNTPADQSSDDKKDMTPLKFILKEPVDCPTTPDTDPQSSNDVPISFHLFIDQPPEKEMYPFDFRLDIPMLLDGLPDEHSQSSVDSLKVPPMFKKPKLIGGVVKNGKDLEVCVNFNNPNFTIKSAKEQFTSLIHKYTNYLSYRGIISPERTTFITSGLDIPQINDPKPFVIAGFKVNQVAWRFFGLCLWDAMFKEIEPNKKNDSKLKKMIEEKIEEKIENRKFLADFPKNSYEKTKELIEKFDPDFAEKYKSKEIPIITRSGHTNSGDAANSDE